MDELKIVNGKSPLLGKCDDSGIGALNFQGTYLDVQNKERPMLSLDKDLSLTLTKIKDGLELQPSLNPSGSVAFYILNEVLSKMFSG